MNTFNYKNYCLLVKLSILVLLIIGCFSQTVLAQHDRSGIIEKKIAQASKLVIDNSFGDLTIVGWDKPDLEAVADDETPLTIKEEGNKVILSAQEFNKHKCFDMSVRVPKNISLEITDKKSGEVSIENITGSTTLVMVSGDVHISKVGNLDVNLSSGDIHAIEVATATLKLKRGDIYLENALGGVNIVSFKGDISIRNIQGDLTCKSIVGDVSLSNVTGLANLSLSSGDVNALNLGSDLLVSSINGEINANCVKGRVEINNASGSIDLKNVSDDVQVVTVSGDISLESAIRPKGRYSLKTTSGDISFLMQDNPPGFSVDLFSYHGEIITGVELKIETNKIESKQGQETLVGRYGDGQAQIKLSAFTGDVTLSKGYKNSPSPCK